MIFANPNSSLLLLLFHTPKPSSAPPTEHPVEVITRIRDFPDGKSKPPSALDVPPDSRSIRLHTEIGYRDFTLDGVSISADESLDSFYTQFIQSRIEGVRAGDRCTIMMCGRTGSGMSHTMFGCAKQPGIVYRALSHILGDGAGLFVQVGVLEIFNEEIYDLLNERGASSGTPKGGTPKVRLEVMGKKAKNATYISGNVAGKLSKVVARVEKRRIVKSTLCNERSSRSHCMIILDVPTVGGRLMLVVTAGSENIEQAGQVGLEAKMQGFYVAALWLHHFHPKTLTLDADAVASFGYMKDLPEILQRLVSGPGTYTRARTPSAAKTKLLARHRCKQILPRGIVRDKTKKASSCETCRLKICRCVGRSLK